MRRFTSLLLGLVATLLLTLSFNAVPTRVYADDLLQTMPSLEGLNIYFTESHTEASRFDRSPAGLSRFAGLLTQMGANLFTLEWRTGFPTDADLIVIAGPNTDFSADQIARLWAYMNNGGRVLLLADTTLETRNALQPTGGLFQLMWADMGLRARNDVLLSEGEAVSPEADPEATAEPTAEADVVTRVPVFTTFAGEALADHPITAGLGADDGGLGLNFFIARSLEVDASIQGFTLTPLAFTAENFYGETSFADYIEDGTLDFNIGSDTTRSALPVAAAYDNADTNSRIVLVGDRQFATNGAGLDTSPPNSGAFVYPDNARFLLNAVAWLVESEPVTIDFPTPGPTATVTITPSPTFTPMPTATPTATPGS